MLQCNPSTHSQWRMISPLSLIITPDVKMGMDMCQIDALKIHGRPFIRSLMRISTKITDWAAIVPIVAISANWTPHLFLAVQVHTSAHCKFDREQQLDSVHPKAGHDRINQLVHIFSLAKLNLRIFFAKIFGDFGSL